MNLAILQGGHRLPLIHHDNQVFTPVPKEGAYEIEIYNDAGRRRLAVVTVDGVNVIDGSKGSYGGLGYVLAAGERLVIRGWLRGDREAAAFTFAPREASYAALTGHGEQSVGIIGVAVFDEVVKPLPAVLPVILHHHHHHPCPPPWVSPYDSPFRWGLSSTAARGDEGDTACSTVQAPSVGTGYGDRVDMVTSSTNFDRQASPAKVLLVRYAVREDLDAWGVPLPASHVTPPPAPPAFPAQQGYAQPPPGWR